MADWMSTYLKALGAPNTARNRNFLSSWQRFEGGHTNNSARFNYLNTTQRMPGSSSMNSVGVQAYGSLQQGAQAFARTLRNGLYKGLYGGLKQSNPYSPQSVAGLSTWLSGSPTAGLDYAHKVLGTHVDAPAPSGGPARVPQSVSQPRAPRTRRIPGVQPNFGRVARLGLMDLLEGDYDPMKVSREIMAEQSRFRPARTEVLPGLPRRNQPSGAPQQAQPVSSGGGFGVPTELFYDPIGGIKFGKQIGAIGGHSDHVHYSAANANEMMKAIRLARTMGMSVRENPAAGDKVDPVHVTGSYHYRRYPKHPNVGEAIDVSGSPQKMAAFYRRLARTH